MLIQTVRGPVDISELGDTMMHEHIFSDHRESFRKRNLEVAERELNELVDAGGRSLVDAGADPRRNMDWYREIADRVGLNIILCTGFYLQKRTPESLWSKSEEEYIRRFDTELREGIDGSGVRAGVIKVAGDKADLTEWEQKVMRAAAKVQRDTGVPICTHACEGARNQFDLLMDSGADPDRIYLSHVEAEFGWEGRTLKEEAEYMLAIAQQGGSLYFNNFNFEFDTPHIDLMYLIRYLCEKGYESRVLFGIDANFRFDDDGTIWWEAQKEHPETANRDYAYTYTGAIPLMKSYGITDELIRTFLVENPKRIFSTTRI